MKYKNEWVFIDGEEACEKGLEVYIDGREYNSRDIKRRRMSIIKEKADYMSDYLYDENGKVVAVHFNKIR